MRAGERERPRRRAWARWNRLDEVNLKVATRRLGDHRRGAGGEDL
jgi:hypothetical protein